MTKNPSPHLITFPSGRVGFVGNIPTSLASKVPATLADVRGGRTFYDETGALVTWKVPSFETMSEARQFAEARGVFLDCPCCRDKGR